MIVYSLSIFPPRYVAGHSLSHSTESEHMLALSFSDLSVWCYCCDNYVDNPR